MIRGYETTTEKIHGDLKKKNNRSWFKFLLANLLNMKKLIEDLSIWQEIECYIVSWDSLVEMSRKETQAVFIEMKNVFGRDFILSDYDNKEIHWVKKTFWDHTVEIGFDSSYAIFEIRTPTPFSNLDAMRKVNKLVLGEFNQILHKFWFIIWPFWIAPAWMNLFNLPFKPRGEIVENMSFINYTKRFWGQARLQLSSYITSCQVSIDIPIENTISMINSLYKISFKIIEKFWNSPFFIDKNLYREGRMWFWEKANKLCHVSESIFPDEPFFSIQDLLEKLRKTPNISFSRDRNVFSAKNKNLTTLDLVGKKKIDVIDFYGKETTLELTSTDICSFLNDLNHLNFKPHFNLNNFSVESFWDFFQKRNIDWFLKKNIKNTYIEIRCCSPHFENDAMNIPIYFYKIFQKHEEFIEKTKKISRNEAKKKYNKSLFFL